MALATKFQGSTATEKWENVEKGLVMTRFHDNLAVLYALRDLQQGISGAVLAYVRPYKGV